MKEAKYLKPLLQKKKKKKLIIDLFQEKEVFCHFIFLKNYVLFHEHNNEIDYYITQVFTQLANCKSQKNSQGKSSNDQ